MWINDVLLRYTCVYCIAWRRLADRVRRGRYICVYVYSYMHYICVFEYVCVCLYGERAMAEEEGVCVYEYMWHAVQIVLPVFWMVAPDGGRQGIVIVCVCVCVCVLEEGGGERSREVIVHTCIACYMYCIYVIHTHTLIWIILYYEFNKIKETGMTI